MGMREDVLALAEELDGVSVKENCDACLASGTELCRGDLECVESAHKACAKRLRAIVDQNEGHANDVSVSAYDLLPEEDRYALAWIRKHGGLDIVASRFECGEIAADMLWGKGHGRFFTTDDFEELISERIMPEGMEWLLEVWPKWSNGEYCKFGDWWTADKYGDYEPKQLRRLVFYTPEQLREWEQDEGDNFGYEWDFMRLSDTTYRPDKAEPPAPKALASDGEPLEVGQTVWHVGDGVEFTVVGLPRPGEYQAVKLRLDDGVVTGLDPDQLTHEQPDTWERLEHDAEKTVCEYLCANYDCANCPFESARCAEEVKKDIIRRARKLAERGGR